MQVREAEIIFLPRPQRTPLSAGVTGGHTHKQTDTQSEIVKVLWAIYLFKNSNQSLNLNKFNNWSQFFVKKVCATG